MRSFGDGMGLMFACGAKPTIGIAALALAAGLHAADAAVEKSGTAVAVLQSTRASGAAGDRTLVTSAPVFMGDRIQTSGKGEAQIELLDNTRLVVGPNSSMVVNSFIFEGGDQAKKVSLNALRGAFRFITGSSRKNAYEIKTPTATIGVRGTQFDFTIGRGGELNFALFEGEARICRSASSCIVLKGACSVAVVPRNRPARHVTSLSERAKILKDEFPLAASQTRLRRDFRVDTSSCSTRRADIRPDGNIPSPTPVTVVAEEPPPSPEITGSIGTNHSGLGDGTNPGQGADHNKSPNADPNGGGTNNPSGNNGNNNGKNK